MDASTRIGILVDRLWSAESSGGRQFTFIGATRCGRVAGHRGKAPCISGMPEAPETRGWGNGSGKKTWLTAPCCNSAMPDGLNIPFCHPSPINLGRPTKYASPATCVKWLAPDPSPTGAPCLKMKASQRRAYTGGIRIRAVSRRMVDALSKLRIPVVVAEVISRIPPHRLT